MSELLGVDVRTIRRWESGAFPISVVAREKIEALEQVAAENVARHVDVLRDAADAVLRTYRTDEDFWAVHPEAKPYPASWHRAVVARVVHEVPGVVIEYPPVGVKGPATLDRS